MRIVVHRDIRVRFSDTAQCSRDGNPVQPSQGGRISGDDGSMAFVSVAAFFS
jgi:hypothetical protein